MPIASCKFSGRPAAMMASSSESSGLGSEAEAMRRGGPADKAVRRRCTLDGRRQADLPGPLRLCLLPVAVLRGLRAAQHRVRRWPRRRRRSVNLPRDGLGRDGSRRFDPPGEHLSRAELPSAQPAAKLAPRSHAHRWAAENRCDTFRGPIGLTLLKRGPSPHPSTIRSRSADLLSRGRPTLWFAESGTRYYYRKNCPGSDRKPYAMIRYQRSRISMGRVLEARG